MKYEETNDPPIRGGKNKKSQWYPLWRAMENRKAGTWMKVTLEEGESEPSMRASATKFFGKGVVTIHRSSEEEGVFYVKKKEDPVVAAVVEAIEDGGDFLAEVTGISDVYEEARASVALDGDTQSAAPEPAEVAPEIPIEAELLTRAAAIDAEDEVVEDDPFFFMADDDEKGPFDD